MNSPSVVSMNVMPAVNRTGRQMIAYQGMCWEASRAVVASRRRPRWRCQSLGRTPPVEEPAVGQLAFQLGFVVLAAAHRGEDPHDPGQDDEVQHPDQQQESRAGRHPCYCAVPSCWAWSTASQKAEMTMSRSPSHLLVWANSRSNAFPVGGITVPSGRVISTVNVPVTFVTTVIQSPLPNWIGYGVCTRMSGNIRTSCSIAAAWASRP